MKRLLHPDELESSSIVANSLMNRERACVGANSYERELNFDALAFLRSRSLTRPQVCWLDLCCGRGKALIEAAKVFAQPHPSDHMNLIGVDLVPFFDPYPAELSFLQLVEASALTWKPDRQFDLISCVHGLHYVGDKLGLIKNAASWLKPDGVFLANLDPSNLKFPGGKNAGNQVIRDLKKVGFDYDAKKHLIICKGKKDFSLNYRYLGADDTAGPNYTGQAAVDSHYEPNGD